jgi:acyl-homoserine lactone synthase
MIHIVTSENRHLFRHALMEMHRQRKTVFIDQMGWELDAPEGLEIDEFDSERATYLIVSDAPRAPVRASARLLPTNEPHLLGEHFSYLCPGGAPRSEAVWEASRFCPAPDTPRGAPRRHLLGLIIAGILETGLLFGQEQVTFVASAALSPLALKVGWNARTLGPSQRHGRDRVTAFVADIDADGLKEVRRRHALGSPITRFIPGALSQAA